MPGRVEPAQVEAGRQRRRHQRIGARRPSRSRSCRRTPSCRSAIAAPARRIGQQPRLQVHAPRDPPQSVRPVPDRVEARHHRQQHLRGADVRRRLLAADVLLAGLQREPHRRCARRVLAHADQPPGHLPLVGVARGEEAGVRAAEAHRHAEALRRAHHHVGAHLAGRRQQRQRQRIGGDDRERAGGVGGRDLGRAGRAPRPLCRGIAAPPRRASPPRSRRCRPARNRAASSRAARRASRSRPGSADAGRRRPRSSSDFVRATACAIATASAAAVASSSSEALAISMPVRSAIMVWKLSSASSRPCAISAWYGV